MKWKIFNYSENKLFKSDIPTFIFTAFSQAIASGAVTASIASKNWPAMFVACYILNELWWYNIGKRVDYSKHLWMGRAYSITLAVGTFIGAWLWR